MMKQYEFTRDQRMFIEGMRQPFVVCQIMGRRVEALAVSDGFCELFGYRDRAQAYADMSQNMYKAVHPDDAARFTSALLQFVTEGSRLEVIYRTKKIDKSGYMVIHLAGEHVYTEDGAHLAHIWYTEEGDSNDGTGTGLNSTLNRALHEGSIVQANRYDTLTGLPSMSYFFEMAENGRRAMLDQGEQPAFLYIDLSGMKHYNHKYGFAEGDKLLQSFSTLLSNIFHTENCCHVSADSFAAIADEGKLEALLGRLFQEWRQMNVRQHLPVCVGVYPNRIEVVPAGMAYDRAKIACDALKGTYSSSYKYFSTDLNEEFEKKQYILENFDRALSEGWIQVYYQPIMRAISKKVCNDEALARWIDPVKGFLSPADFIPHLEDAGLIYKLDLYVLDRVLENIREQEAGGLYIVPHSINLSRSDFVACDIVEEIRRRVDAAGVGRDKISIEITESVIGSDFDFMKAQVQRFQALGFPVWMDDFGSGYSSLDVLQSIKFDLLKFDMNFMRRLDESSDGRIILTELMKMALSLGVDTVCEGVETEEQSRFLQEIGCSKLQGFFFGKPESFQTLIKWHLAHKADGYENPEESAYYESICGLNLYDVSVIAREEKTSIQNAYTTLPMAIIEIKGDCSRFARTNQSYRDFFKRFFGSDPTSVGAQFVRYNAAFMNNIVKTCCEQGLRAFYDEKMPDGSIVHSFARRIDINPVTGNIAVAIAVLSIREPNESLLFEQILSVIEQFGEHMPGGFFIYRADESGQLLYANRAVCDIFGCDSLEDFKALTGFTFRGMVHPDDYEKINASIEDQVRRSRSDLDFVEYRIIRKDGQVRWIDDYGHYIEYDDYNGLYYVFISDATDKHEQAESDKALHSAVIEALTRAYDSVWLIRDIETQRFELVRVDKEMEHLMPANIAAKIEKFSQAFAFYSRLVFEEDQQRFLDSVAPQAILRNTGDRPIYSVPFRRVFEDGVRHYRVEFARIDLPGGKTGIVTGFKNVDEAIRHIAREQ